MSRPSPIPAFLQAFAGQRDRDLEPFLHEDVAYKVEGFAPLEGRRDVLSYWRRMFESHRLIRMSLERHMRDGDVVIVAHRQVYSAFKRPPLVLEGMAVFELAQEKIRAWDDGLRAADLPAEEADLWSRLRSARW